MQNQVGQVELPVFGAHMVKQNNWPVISFFAVTTAGALIGTPLYILRFGISKPEVILFSFYVAATAFAITMGYHRLYAHRAFKTNRVIQFLVLFFGAAAFEQSALTWCSGHRDHHRYVDTEQDPYNIKKGFWYAHIGWMTLWKQWPDYGNVMDLFKNKLVRHQHDHYVAWGAVSGILLPIFLGALSGHALGALVFSVCARLTLVYHATFCINSVCHTFGKRTYDIRSTARDHWLVALFTNGEGYHNFHHRFPTDYRNGVRWYQWDPSKWMIALLERAGLAWEVRRTKPLRIREAREAAKRERERPAGAVLIVASGLFLLSAMCPAAEAGENGQFLTLPDGDPVAGRQSFKDLKCNSCHRISSDIEMAGPIAKAGAPDLGLRQSRYRPSYLADSVVFPNHAVLTREGRFDPFAGSSRMGDFSDTLTVKQLADIVAYLKQLDEEV